MHHPLWTTRPHPVKKISKNKKNNDLTFDLKKRLKSSFFLIEM